MFKSNQRPMQIVPPVAQIASTEAHIVPTKAQLVPTEAQHVSTEAYIMPTEIQQMSTETHHLFQEIKTESLETQNMTPNIYTEAPGFVQTDSACEHLEKDSKPQVIIRISFCWIVNHWYLQLLHFSFLFLYSFICYKIQQINDMKILGLSLKSSIQREVWFSVIRPKNNCEKWFLFLKKCNFNIKLIGHSNTNCLF